MRAGRAADRLDGTIGPVLSSKGSSVRGEHAVTSAREDPPVHPPPATPSPPSAPKQPARTYLAGSTPIWIARGRSAGLTPREPGPVPRTRLRHQPRPDPHGDVRPFDDLWAQAAARAAKPTRTTAVLGRARTALTEGTAVAGDHWMAKAPAGPEEERDGPRRRAGRSAAPQADADVGNYVWRWHGIGQTRRSYRGPSATPSVVHGRGRCSAGRSSCRGETAASTPCFPVCRTIPKPGSDRTWTRA